MWEAIPTVPNLQCGWQILLQSANPRADHTLRPSRPVCVLSTGNCTMKGSGTRQFFGQLLGTEDSVQDAKRVASLPMRMGGLGLRSAVRGADTAYLTSWADAIQKIDQRNPVVANMVVATTAQEAPPAEQCLSELRGATDRLDREGYWWTPNWRSLREGQRRPEPEVGEPGEWRRGWQYWYSCASDSHFRKEVTLHGRTAARWAHLRSPSGFNASTALAHCPTAPEYTACSGPSCSRGCSCHCKSLKRGVRVAMLFSTPWAATERLAPKVAE